MEHMSSAFQTAVRSAVRREKRLDALDRLAEEGDARNLRLFVQLDGMSSGLRRHALTRLAGCNASGELERIANDYTLDSSLRADAERHR